MILLLGRGFNSLRLHNDNIKAARVCCFFSDAMNIIDILFPRKCFECGQNDYYLCPKCVSKAKEPILTCPICNGDSPYGVTHIRCRDPLGLDGRLSLWRYSKGIRKAIMGMKYKFAFEIAKDLSNYAADELKQKKIAFPNNLIVTSVPLYWHRQNWRGFNQSEEIGKIIAKKLGWGFDNTLLTRKVSKKPQAKLDREERKTNIKGVFKVSSVLDKDRPILIFDDVWTTGSTVKEATKVLKENGVKRVYCLTLAS